MEEDRDRGKKRGQGTRDRGQGTGDRGQGQERGMIIIKFLDNIALATGYHCVGHQKLI